MATLAELYEDWKAQPRMAAIGGLLMGDTKPLKEMMGSKPWPTQMPTGKSNMTPEQKRAAMQDAYNVAMDINNPMTLGGLLGHTVWHGSPHKFDKFDMSKIGTGEGAQAYGHGLYFAEAPDVAKGYASAGMISPKGVVTKTGEIAQSKGRTSNLSNAKDYAVDALVRFDGDKQGALSWLDDFGTDLEAKKWIKANVKGNKAQIQDASNFYKVDIPDEILPRMLDWDKPLSQQDIGKSLQVTKNPSPAFGDEKWLLNIGDRSINAFKTKKEALQMLDKTTGADLYRSLDAGGAIPGVNYLKDAGIPGIRYLDGNSRVTGGTSNFVLFDDRLPRIIERNGVPTGLKPWKDDPATLADLLK